MRSGRIKQALHRTQASKGVLIQKILSTRCAPCDERLGGGMTSDIWAGGGGDTIMDRRWEMWIGIVFVSHLLDIASVGVKTYDTS